jgi:nucleoid DNA-binding protein
MVKDKREIIHYLANKYNLPLSKIEEMVNHQFKVVSDVMGEGEFSTVRIPYFGKFSVNPNRVKHINRLKNESSKIKD